MILRIVRLVRFQSTLPRRERRQQSEMLMRMSDVSIHAPAKGATMVAKDLGTDTYVSIHAPAKGATKSFESGGLEKAGFNPRSREGSDTCSFPLYIL